LFGEKDRLIFLVPYYCAASPWRVGRSLFFFSQNEMTVFSSSLSVGFLDEMRYSSASSAETFPAPTRSRKPLFFFNQTTVPSGVDFKNPSHNLPLHALHPSFPTFPE